MPVLAFNRPPPPKCRECGDLGTIYLDPVRWNVRCECRDAAEDDDARLDYEIDRAEERMSTVFAGGREDWGASR